MCANQGFKLVVRRGVRPDKRGDNLVARVRPRRQGKETQHAGLLGRQASVRQVEGRADVTLAVVEVAK
jgi:hypothetical protein